MPRLCIGLRRDRSSATVAASAASGAEVAPALSASTAKSGLRRASRPGASSARPTRNLRSRARRCARAKIALNAPACALIFHRKLCSFWPLDLPFYPLPAAQYFALCENAPLILKKRLKPAFLLGFSAFASLL